MKRVIFIFAALTLLFSGMALSQSLAPEESGSIHPACYDPLEVGAAMLDITPEKSVVLGGYGMYAGRKKNCRWSEGINDRLYATAIAMSMDCDVVIFIELDSVGLVSKDINVIREAVAKKLGIKRANIIVGSSHSHATPDPLGLWGTVIPAYSGRDESYMDFVIQQAVDAATDAYAAKQPAKISYAVGQEAELHFNTYSDQIPNAYIDHTLTVLKAVNQKGEIIATMTNWGCHPTTENGKNLLISADWVAPYRDALKKEYGGIHMFINGSIGAAIQPSVPWRDKHVQGDGQGFIWAKAMGENLAKKTKVMFNSAQPLHFGNILVESRPVTVKMKNFAFWLAASSGQLDMNLPPYGAKYTTEVVAVQMGELRFGTIPGEISPQLGNEIRGHLGGKAQVLVGLGQDALGYIIDEKQYNDRMYAYEKLLCLNPAFGSMLVSTYRGMCAGWADKNTADK